MTPLMMIVLGSIFAGWATPTESGAVGVFGAFEQDLAYLVGRLVAAGFAQIALVDLSRPDFAEVAVVRAVIPGLATLFDHPAAAPWPPCAASCTSPGGVAG